ncbi:MAG: 5-formyltetrahydrofolate cyclo-ligase [Nocardioides sp.]
MHPSPTPPAAKTALRDQLLTARNRRSLAEVYAAGAAITERLLALEEVRRAASVAAYVSVGREPGTGLLLDALRTAGKQVLLPLTRRTDEGVLDLDWAAYEGPDSLAPARFGLLEPSTPPLGLDAIATPDVVLVPGMAVSAAGFRIGKGAGCYDRALRRVPVGTFTCVVLYDDEVGRDVPVEPHDLPVLTAVSPAGLTRLRPTPPPARA